jgi:hypothetical protein
VYIENILFDLTRSAGECCVRHVEVFERGDYSCRDKLCVFAIMYSRRPEYMRLKRTSQEKPLAKRRRLREFNRDALMSSWTVGVIRRETLWRTGVISEARSVRVRAICHRVHLGLLPCFHLGRWHWAALNRWG